MKETEENIISYWNRRAPTYTDVIMKNLEGVWEKTWADMLIAHFPEGSPSETRVLDVGTGPGFYAIILANRGFRVTAVDFSERMLEEARHNSGALAGSIEFLRMDACELSFPDCSFDCVVTRNLTWNLTEPEKAYREWFRVLRPGGVALIFDANWYAYLNDESKRLEYERDRVNTVKEGVEDHGAYEDSHTMEEISRELPMTCRKRPHWDLAALLDTGFSSVFADTTVSDRVWSREEKINYASTPGFLIRAVK